MPLQDVRNDLPFYIANEPLCDFFERNRISLFKLHMCKCEELFFGPDL